MKLQYVQGKNPVNIGDIIFIKGKSHSILGIITPKKGIESGGVMVQTMCERKDTAVIPLNKLTTLIQTSYDIGEYNHELS